jgi:Zn-dependent peptidase ImmA (M78 family)
MPLNLITKERQAEIEDLVHGLQLSVGLSYPENSLTDIIKAAVPDVMVTESDFNGKSNIRGAVFRRSEEYERPLIAIQAKQSKPSKTFALAHEFAHYVLEHNPQKNYYIDDQPFNGSKLMQDEAEANFFAQILLMPKDLFAKLDQPFVNDKQLAERFGVTEGAVRVRRSWLERNGF